MTEEWLDFIVACRSGQSHDYDIVEGPMADDTIYNYVQNFIDGGKYQELPLGNLLNSIIRHIRSVFIRYQALDTLKVCRKRGCIWQRKIIIIFFYLQSD